MIPHYHINVFWSDKVECWIADVPDLADCATRGDTAREAVAAVQQAMIDCVAAALNDGRSLPLPSYKADAA